MTWRYQPVWIGDEGEQAVTLCEVYLDESGLLKSWTANPRMEPMGETVDELLGDLKHMMECASEWAPVQFAEMISGMGFERVQGRRRRP